MTKRSCQKPIKVKVHVAIKVIHAARHDYESIDKVFKGAKLKAATKYAREQEKACIDYGAVGCSYRIETWEVS